jgi:RNA polymerase sigma-32 factor
MADRSKARGKPARKPAVIDVGEGGAAKTSELDDDDDEDARETDEPQGVDAELADSSNAIDVSPIAEVAADGDDDDDAADKRPVRRGSLAVRDPMGAYMAEVRRYPLLSAEEEETLSRRLIEHNDRDAARRLVEANLRLVVKIAHEFRRAHANLLDLVQEGNIGLINAVRKFDPSRNVKLASYATYWIRAYILKFLLNNWRLVKVGTTQTQRKLFYNLRKERDRLEQLGFTPSSALLAKNLDVSEREVIEMERRLAAPEASLDAPIGRDPDDANRTRLDVIPSDAQRPDHAAEQVEFQNLIRVKLERFAEGLDEREQQIFRDRLLRDEPLTLQEIGERYHVSRERVRQIEKQMVARLKKYLERELGTDVDIGAMTRE